MHWEQASNWQGYWEADGLAATPIGTKLLVGSSYVGMYDPATDAYAYLPDGKPTPTTSMLDPPRSAKLTLLPDSRHVLALGGANGTFSASNYADLIDLETATVRPVAFMNGARKLPWSFVLPNSKVLVTGNEDGVHPPKSEIYDPAADTWTVVDVPKNFLYFDDDYGPTSDAAVVQLASGDVFATPSPSGECESTYRYDWRANVWSEWTPRPEKVAPHSAVELPDGRILATGGTNCTKSAVVADAWMFDPKTETWTKVASMHHVRQLHSSIYLPCGRVLVIGGQGEENTKPEGGSIEDAVVIPAVEIYDPVADAWYDLPDIQPNAIRNRPQLALLPDGSVFVGGGRLTPVLPRGTCVTDDECNFHRRPLFLRPKT